MGLFKSQLANVVEWEEYRDDVIFYKWNNSEIKKGSRLIIRPGQDAIFLYNGVTEGVFEKEGNLYTTSELFSEEEIDDFFDCGVEDIENIIDIDKRKITIIISSVLLIRRGLWKRILLRGFDFLY